MSSRCRSCAICVSATWPLPRRLAAILLACGIGAAWEVEAGEAGTNGAPRVLRVAADPNNLPFSNDRLEGFENRIAELLARELGARLEYAWWPQRRGFIRNTIGAGNADIVIGVPAGYDLVLTTRPYYRSTYAFVFRKDAAFAVRSLDDSILRDLTIGVQIIGDDFMNAPPAHALTRRGMIDNIRGYTVYGNYAEESPPSKIIQAVAAREVDVAVVWGPLAGYFSGRQQVPIEVVPVAPLADGPLLPFTFSISVGVRRGDTELRDKVQTILERKKEEIDAILEQFRVPRVELKPGIGSKVEVGAAATAAPEEFRAQDGVSSVGPDPGAMR